MQKKKLTLIRGLPGSGKSTLGAALAKAESGILLEADQFFVNSLGEYSWNREHLSEAHHWCQEKTKEFLTQNTPVFVANTFTTARELLPYFMIAQDFDIIPTVILMQNMWGNIHGTPKETLEKMDKRFEYKIDFLFDLLKDN